MPPRYSYWTIIAGGLPTAFRAAERDDLMPTFKRLLEKHPDAEMKWFARGKIWESPEAAREDTEARRRPPEGHRAPLGDRPPGPPRERRGRDWRPGGEHRDPRQKYKDAKKKGNQDRRQERFDRKERSARVETPRDTPPEVRPLPDRDRPRTPDTRDKRDWRDRPPRSPEGAKAGPPRDKPHGDPLRRDVRPKFGPPRTTDRPKGPPRGPDWRDRAPREKPHGDPMRRDVPPAGRAPFKSRPPFKARPPFKDRPPGKDRPPFNRDAPPGERERPRDRDRGAEAPKPWRGGGGAGPPRPAPRRDDRPGGSRPPRSGSGAPPRPLGRRDDRPRGPKPPRSGGGGGGGRR